MKSEEKLLLKLIRSAVFESNEDFSEFSEFENWNGLFSLCSKHSVVGVVYDCFTRAFGERVPAKYALAFKQIAFQEMSFQTVRSMSFETVYKKLRQRGFAPVILKGEVLRRLYPQPESRTSLDEDFLINEKDYPALKNELTLSGFEEVNEGEDDKHWVNKKYSLYFEIHFSPFSKEKSYEKWNSVFENYDKRIIENENGVVSLSREDNLIFLILHAAKHFIYSGVGIKQILDIALFMKEYQNDMDFSYIKNALKKTKMLTFAEELTAFIEQYLYGGVHLFGKRQADADFVSDVMSGGSLGKGDEERVHSANVTASAFKGKSSLKKILFPPKERLYRKYPFCKKFKILIPVAWVMRILSYIFKNRKKSALKTGNTRLKMLKKYGLINK